jgi:type II secretory pathway component HofQ
MSGATEYSRSRLGRALLFTIPFLLVATVAGADTIYLKSGKKVRADKTWEEGGQIKANLFGATIGYDKSDVLRVEKNRERPPAGDIATEPEEPQVPKISPDFYQADLRKVLNMLRDVSGMNFAVDPDVSGNVTLTIEAPVPWTEVLDVVLKMNNLGKEQFGEKTLRIYSRTGG